MNRLWATLCGVIMAVLLAACSPVDDKKPTAQAQTTQAVVVPLTATAVGSTQTLRINTPMASIFPLEAMGGTKPYSYTADGVIAGLSLNESTGEVSGIPTEISGPTVLVFSVKDANGNVATTKSAVTFVVQSAPTRTISGIITDWNLAGIGGVTVIASPGGITATTGPDGTYVLTVLDGLYVVTPTPLEGMTFVRASTSVPVNGANENGINFLTPQPPAPPAPTPVPDPVPTPPVDPVPAPTPVPDPVEPSLPVVVSTATVKVRSSTDGQRICNGWTLESINVTPAIVEIEGGNRQTFRAKGKDSEGDCFFAEGDVTWVSTEGSIAPINFVSGTVVGKKPGETTIKAKVGSIAGVATLYVIEPPISFAPPTPPQSVIDEVLNNTTSVLVVGPSNETAPVGTMTQYFAFHRATGEAATDVIWSSSDPTVGNIDWATGKLAFNQHPGVGIITATLADGSGSGSTIITRTDVPYIPSAPIVPSSTQTLTSVVITPSLVTCSPKQWHKFNAKAFDENGQPYNVYIVWTSSDAGVFEIDPVTGNGICKGVGNATVTATTSFAVPQPPAPEPIAP